MIRATGDPREIVPRIAAELGAEVTWNRRYHLTDVDAQVKEATGATSHPGFLLTEPWAGKPYKVFTPFSKAVQAALSDAPPQPLPAPDITPLDIDTAEFSDRAAEPEPFWASDTLATHCTPGEDAALERFHNFLEHLADGGGYDNDDLSGHSTTGLSPHLRFGEISPGYIWAEASALDAPGVWAMLRQVIWRDFAWHRYFHVPDMTTRNVREQFDRFEWSWAGDTDHLADLALWQRGETGVPLVDAGMRELWATGTMHNRVRMVAASWLTKNLGIHWRHGEEWFWDTLVDADVASNPFNWQWVAGSGDDAAPYFRIFNPLLQQEKFDPGGSYVQRWVPEAFTPLYPEPMVDVKESRKRALESYQEVRSSM
ncbi:DNA photolyase family protein [Corynebacterium sp. TA-R-1]|uniref:DNA photolyase family protein n=1 Tax=Corynebacterium stercoris TaxID=2943490 RepID=A0ABT1G4U7_9CORY|nr:DNA photolyase family protein [Corynebacterium stercoris]